MKNQVKKDRILAHIEKSLETKSAGRISVDEGNHILLVEIKSLLEQLLANQVQPKQVVASEPDLIDKAPKATKRANSWKFWLKN